jgi:hypothetical protein
MKATIVANKNIVRDNRLLEAQLTGVVHPSLLEEDVRRAQGMGDVESDLDGGMLKLLVLKRLI